MEDAFCLSLDGSSFLVVNGFQKEEFDGIFFIVSTD